MDPMNDSIKVHIYCTAQEIRNKFCQLEDVLPILFPGEWKAELANTSLTLRDKIRLYLVTDERDRPEKVRILYEVIGSLHQEEISEILIRTRIEFILALHK